MTSTFATNFVSSKLSKKRYLETNAQGQPLQGQVPLTYQLYTGTGNETIPYDGSNVLVLDSTLASGDLTVDFSSMNDWCGRTLQFIVLRTLTNDCILDFGSGQVYFPPFSGSASSVTLNAAQTPTVAEMCFIDPTTAVITDNPTVAPQNIIPGGPGQVLTTNAGTGIVGWEDPVSVAPKVLTFKISTDPTNDLNTNTATRVQFDSTTGSNDTTLTVGEIAPGLATDFTVVDETKYSISYSIFSVHDPSIALRGFIGINGDLYCYMESSLGITGQTLSGTLTVDLAAGDIIGVYVGNASGAMTTITPTTDYYGLLCITQF